VPETCDIAIVGAGAAGLMAAIWAGRSWHGLPVRTASGHTLLNGPATSPRPRILALDGAKILGAKVLVAGGGRCNVTHDIVDEAASAGSTRNAIRKVLGRFTVAQTIEFFKDLGVELKREETGKLFPTTDDSHTVLSALLAAARDAGVELRHPYRVESIARAEAGFLITPSPGHLAASSPPLLAHRVILATGGRALPKTGSDGHGYEIARSLGHTITRTLPALVPLTLPRDHFLCALSGIALPAALELRSPTGKKLVSFTDSTLLTHFGLSGPSVLDISRYYLDARTEHGAPQLLINFLPHHTPASLDTAMLNAARSTPHLPAARFFADHGKPPLPDRLARALCRHAGLDPAAPLHQLPRDHRRALISAAVELSLPITGDRGYTYAEATAGGVPLSELHLETMESRFCPGLYICGEICDVDGRIGGFNFQWAWASGFVAGCAAARAARPTRP